MSSSGFFSKSKGSQNGMSIRKLDIKSEFLHDFLLNAHFSANLAICVPFSFSNTRNGDCSTTVRPSTKNWTRVDDGSAGTWGPATTTAKGSKDEQHQQFPWWAKKKGKEGSKKGGGRGIGQLLAHFSFIWENGSSVVQSPMPNFLSFPRLSDGPNLLPPLRLPINQLFLRQNRRKRKAKKWFGLANK